MNKIIGLIKTQTMRYLFGAAKNKKAASDYISSEDLPLVLNDNLRFNAQSYELFMVPKHPQVETESKNKMIFNTTSILMEFHFLNKKYTETICKEMWKESKVMKLKFHHLGKILDIEPGKGQQHSLGIQRHNGKDKVQQLYQIRDSLNDRRIQFWMREIINKQRHLDLYKTSITYQDFETIQEIIRESLFDLSGLRLQLDLRRMEELEKVSKVFKANQKALEEIDQYYQDN